MPSAKPDGAFYVFADCSSVLGRTSPAGRPLDTAVQHFTRRDISDYLLRQQGRNFKSRWTVWRHLYPVAANRLLICRLQCRFQRRCSIPQV